MLFQHLGVGIGVVVAAEDAQRAWRSPAQTAGDAYVIGEITEGSEKGGSMLKTRIAVFVSGGGTNLQKRCSTRRQPEKIPSGESSSSRESNPKGLCPQRAARGRNGRRRRAAPAAKIRRRWIGCAAKAARDNHPRRLYEASEQAFTASGPAHPQRPPVADPRLLRQKGFYGLHPTGRAHARR